MSFITDHELYCDVLNPTPGCQECENEVEQDPDETANVTLPVVLPSDRDRVRLDGLNVSRTSRDAVQTLWALRDQFQGEAKVPWTHAALYVLRMDMRERPLDSRPIDMRCGDQEPRFAHQVERDNPQPVAVRDQTDDEYRRYIRKDVCPRCGSDQLEDYSTSIQRCRACDFRREIFHD